MQWLLGPQRHDAQRVRREAVTWLSEQGLGPLDDIALIIAELLANAIKAAEGRVVLDLTVSEGRVQICVTDDGAGFQEQPQPELPPLEAEGRRGLYLVQALGNGLLVDQNEGGTTVCCSVVLNEGAAPA